MAPDMTLSRWLVLVVALVLVGAVAPCAHAAGRPKVAVLEIRIEGDAAPELRDQLDKSLAGGLYAAGWDVISRASVAKRLEATPELAGCVTTTCLERLGDMLGTSRFVRVRVSATGAAYVVELELLAADVATGPIARMEKNCAPCTFDEANEMMSQAAEQLREGAGDKVVVRVTSEPPGAVVELDGKAIGVAPLEVEVLPGDHVFRAKLAGRADAVQNTTVAAQEGGDPQVVAITLAGDAVPAGGGAAVGGSDEGARPFKVWKWAAAVGAVAAIGTGVYLLAIDGDGIDCPSGPGLCPEHKDTAVGGTVLTVVGVGLGGVATWMFLVDKPGERGAQVAARPLRGGGAMLTVGGSF
jgi:hypothetical protein